MFSFFFGFKQKCSPTLMQTISNFIRAVFTLTLEKHTSQTYFVKVLANCRRVLALSSFVISKIQVAG